MEITIHRQEEYNRFVVVFEKGFDVQEITMYDMSITELAEFIRVMVNQGDKLC